MSIKTKAVPPPGSTALKTARKAKTNYLSPDAKRRFTAVLEHCIRRLAITEEILWHRSADNEAVIELWLNSAHQLRIAHTQLSKLQVAGEGQANEYD